jgi:hypothetical protein
MFKVVTEVLEGEKPGFLMVCDHMNCGATATMPADVSSAEALRKDQAVFISKAMQAGWAVGLDAQLCPPHKDRMVKERQIVDRERRIVTPGTDDVERIMKKVVLDAERARVRVGGGNGGGE